MDVLDRVMRRIPDCTADDDVIQDYIDTVSDRLWWTIHDPTIFESVCVDAAVKMYRRTYYEGISSEDVANLSTSFVEDILDEYAEEILRYRDRQANGSGGSGKVVSFL